MPEHPLLFTLALLGLCTAGIAGAQEASPFRSAEDGAFDVSGFLDEAYGFLPMVVPITEPAIGYGAAVGVGFIDKPLGQAKQDFERPNITMVGGLGTENGTWGVAAGDMRHWFGGRLQTLAGAVYASVNLDFYGIGDNSLLNDDPLEYNLETRGGLVQGKYRLADTRLFGGLGYAFAATDVSFDAPAGSPGIPSYTSRSDVGGITPSLTFDTRDNIFTPISGTYAEASAGLFANAFGSDDDFQRARLTMLQFVPLHPRLFLGLRGEGTASFGDTPFYLKPFIMLRGVPMMRYQGDEVAYAETELRWQCWKRYSLLGFAGGGAAWNDFARVENRQSVLSGGFGFRYELAREHGIHAGLDIAFSDDDAAVYIQVGSAWARP